MKVNTSSAGAISPLAKFLIDRASQNLSLANYLYWYLKVELQNNPSFTEKYNAVFSGNSTIMQLKHANISFFFIIIFAILPFI